MFVEKHYFCSVIFSDCVYQISHALEEWREKGNNRSPLNYTPMKRIGLFLMLLSMLFLETNAQIHVVGCAVTGVDTANATLSWSPEGGTPLNYTVAYKNMADASFTETITNDTFLILAGLLPNTAYSWKVRANSSSAGVGSWSEEMTFVTFVKAPFSCDFEDSLECYRWQYLNHTIGWYVGSATHNGGGHSLYVSGDSGATNAYYVVTFTESCPWAYRDIYFDPAASFYQLSYDAKVNGCSDARASVFLGPPAQPPAYATPPDSATCLLYNLWGYPNWKTFTHRLDSSFAGYQRLYFLWFNIIWTLHNPPAAIDNVVIEAGYCATQPTNLSAITSDTEAWLSWTDAGTAVSYDVRYKSETDILFTEVQVTGTTCELDNLAPATSYVWQVRPNCSATEHGLWETSCFQTRADVADIPYLCDFEDSSENTAWTFVNANTNQWHVGSGVSYGGANALYISNDNGVNNAYDSNSTSTAWAYRDIQVNPDLSDYVISFDFRGMGEIWANHNYDYARVFVGPPATPSGESVPTQAIQVGSDLVYISDWTTFSDTISIVPTPVLRLYLFWNNDNSYGTNPPAAFDNIRVYGCGTFDTDSCESPSNLVVDNVTDHSITIHFTRANEEDSLWQTVIVPDGQPVDSAPTEIIADTSHIFDNLQSNTLYRIYIRTVCDNNHSDWDSITQTTDLDQGVEEYLSHFSVTLFPNPTTGYCEVLCDDGFIECVQVYDISGRSLMLQKCDSTQASIDISGYALGLYLIRITTDKAVVTRRLILGL